MPKPQHPRIATLKAARSKAPTALPASQRPVSDSSVPLAFQTLTWEQQQTAMMWLHKFCKRWGNDLPPWRYGILVGTAKRLALFPFDSARGLSVFRSRAGQGFARKCKLLGYNPSYRKVLAERGVSFQALGLAARRNKRLSAKTENLSRIDSILETKGARISRN